MNNIEAYKLQKEGLAKFSHYNKFINKMNKYRFLTFIWMFFSCSTGEQLNDTCQEIYVPFKGNEKSIDLSEVVSNVRYIKLETKPGFLLGSILHCEIIDKIYCFSSNKIDAFDLDGNFIFEINHFQKKGPEGYSDLSCFNVDTINNKIEIWDRFRRRIVSYNNYDGGFIKGQPFNVSAFLFLKYEDTYFFYSGYQPNEHLTNNKNLYHIYQFDEKGKFMKSYLNEKATNKMTPMRAKPAFYKYDKTFYFNPGANSTVYKYMGNEFIPAYFLNFGNNAIPDNYFEDRKRWYVRDIYLSEFAFLSRSFCEYEFGYTFCYSQGLKNEYRVLLSKNLKKLYVTSNKGFINDFDGGWPLPLQFIKKDLFFTCYDAFMFRNIYNNLKSSIKGDKWDTFKKDHGQFCSICENLKDDDNPILVLMTPKKINSYEK